MIGQAGPTSSMPIILERIPPIAALLKEAALARGTVTLATLRAAFGDVGADADLYATLEAAGDTLANPRVAMYTSLLATGLLGMPTEAFYAAYRGHRYVEFMAIAPGVAATSQLTVEQRFRMAESERSRVYRHADAALAIGPRQRSNDGHSNAGQAAAAL